MKRILIIALAVLLTVPFCLLAGCGKDSEVPKYMKVEGRVVSINLETGAVKMCWYNPKKQREVTREGKLDPNAEILINGVVAQLEDLRVGDRVKVVGRIEKSGDDKQLFATKVSIARPKAIELDQVTQPAAGK